MIRRLILAGLLCLWSATAGMAQSVFTPQERDQEIAQKLARVHAYLEREHVGGLLLTQVRNYSWITAGQGDNHIVITAETGPDSILILRNGKKYVVTANDEADRVKAEDVRGLGYEVRTSPWYEDGKLALVHQLAGDEAVVSDTALGDLKVVDDDVTDLRTPLTPNEIKKYRWLGRNTTDAVVEVCRKLKPGMSERTMESLTSDALMRRNIRPTVLLMGTDDRILHFRHAIPSDYGVLQHYGMVNVCARRWGLVIAVTRFVHFGPLPATLKHGQDIVVNVNARTQAATVEGATSGQMLDKIKTFYAANGMPDEWTQHHQGGSIGYAERDWLARPGATPTIHLPQAFAWNPTALGAKVEDTVLVFPDHIENLTLTPGWPTIETVIGGKSILSPSSGFASSTL